MILDCIAETCYEPLVDEVLAEIDRACPNAQCADPQPYLNLLEAILGDLEDIAGDVEDPCPDGGGSPDTICHENIPSVGVPVGGDAAPGYFDNMRPTENDRRNCFDGDTGDGWNCQTDNPFLTVFFDKSVVDPLNVRRSLTESFNTTVLKVVELTTETTTGNYETDIIYRAEPALPALGVAYCDDAVTDIKCDQHYALFRSAKPIRRVGCHETGHAVGLTHGEFASDRNGSPVYNGHYLLACMKTEAYPTQFLGPHNTRMVNNTYGTATR